MPPPSSPEYDPQATTARTAKQLRRPAATADRAAIRAACEAITADLDRTQYVGLCHKCLRAAPPQHPERFKSLANFWWPRSTLLDMEADEWMRQCFMAERDWARAHAMGLRRAARHLAGTYMPGETLVRLAACTTVPLEGDRHRGGGRADLSHVLGFMVDLDVTRPGDARAYCPTTAEAASFLADFPHTWLVDAAHTSMPLVVLLDRSSSDIDACHRLGADLREHVRLAAMAEGWHFDSPPPLTAWLKLPGGWSFFRNGPVVIVATDQRWAFADLRDVVPYYEHHQPTGYVDMTRWNSQPIPRPSAPRGWGTKSVNSWEGSR
jgi:hypothetical protein